MVQKWAEKIQDMFKDDILITSAEVVTKYNIPRKHFLNISNLKASNTLLKSGERPLEKRRHRESIKITTV